MSDSEDAIVLEMPVQHLDAPRFCAADCDHLRLWVEQLPRGDLGNTSRQLFEAVQELNSCRLEPELRFELLEVLRPHVYSVCSSLGIHYHNQPIVLPSKAFQVYLLSQTMQMHLAMGYQVVAQEAASLKKGILKKKTRNPQLLARALHRAITDLCCTLFRGCLIYSEYSPGIWRQLHSLYWFACSQGLAQESFKDMESGQVYPTTIEQGYCRALLLGSVRSNQLRQEDLTLVFDCLCEWITKTRLTEYSNAGEDHIVANLASDDPPVFNALFTAPADARHCRVLVVEDLLHHLGELLADNHHRTFSDDLIKHLMISWGSFTRRTFVRMDSTDSLQVCIGMSNLHYFSADQTEFQTFIRGRVHRPLQDGSETNLFLKETMNIREAETDLWNTPYNASKEFASISLESIDNHIRKFDSEARSDAINRSYDDHQVKLLNVSAGGYALQWPAQAQAKLSNGEIVGIRECNNQNWSIGIVSWIRRSGKEVAQVGLKLLAPTVVPYAARVVNRGPAAANDNNDEFRRVLLLPEIQLIGQSATLITSQVSFREKQTLLLVQQDRQITVRLKKLLSSTGVIKQFGVEVVDKPWQQEISSQADKDRFNELWDSL